MGVNYGHLCSVANGRRPWTPLLRERATAVLGEVPGQGVVYRQGGLVQGRAPASGARPRVGPDPEELAHRVGVSVGYMSEVARGRKNMGPEVQARVEKALGGPVEIAPASCANRHDGPIQGQSSYIRERARELGFSLRGLAEHVGVSYGYMVQVSRGQRNMSPAVQAQVEAALDGPARIRTRPASHRGPASTVGPDGSAPDQPERDGQAGRHQFRPSLPDHERPANSVGRSSGEGCTGCCSGRRRGTGGPRRGEGDGLEEGGRNGVVVRGAGGPGAGGNQPGGGTVRIGGRVPWGAEWSTPTAPDTTAGGRCR